jgi:hypothetical protein
MIILTEKEEQQIKSWYFAIIRTLNQQKDLSTHLFYCPYHKDVIMKVEYNGSWKYELFLVEEPPKLSELDLTSKIDLHQMIPTGAMGNYPLYDRTIKELTKKQKQYLEEN